CRISILTVALVSVHRKVAQRDVRSSRRERLPRRRYRYIGRSVVDAVVVRAVFYKETGAATQSRDAPMAAGRKKQTRDERAPVDNQCDRMIHARRRHRSIDTRPVIRSNATGVLI